MAGTIRAPRTAHHELTFGADLHSNNSFDSGANLMPAFQGGAFMDQVSAFTSVNGHSAAAESTRTVSPKDIFADAFGSAPPSTAFTNLTSPDIGESPYLHDSFECSPMFENDMNLSNNNSDWFSLFPEDASNTVELNSTAAPLSLPMERTISSQSMERSGSSSMGSPIVLDSSSFRRKSSVNNSPATNGISKARRRKGPLPAITVDPGDKTAIKRARNTLAARESRQRKFDHVSELEKKNADLQAEVEKWKNIAIAQGYNAL
jgi:general control protein GCN4